MADEVRESQNVVEIASTVSSPVRESQNVVEVAHLITIGIRESQNIVELMSSISANMRITQNIVEILYSGIPQDVSGIYFINPVKATRHDSYNNSVERKIPNPMIRTALIGE